MKKSFLLVAVMCLGTLPLLTHAADDKASDADAKPVAKTVHRLPAQYGKLVDKSQREKIYAIQAKYAEKIEDLQEQLKELMLQRDAEIRAVLTTEQQKKLDELLSAAKGKRAARNSEVKDAASKTDEAEK